MPRCWSVASVLSISVREQSHAMSELRVALELGPDAEEPGDDVASALLRGSLACAATVAAGAEEAAETGEGEPLMTDTARLAGCLAWCVSPTCAW